MRQGFLSSKWAKAQHIYTNDHNQTTRNNWSRIITSKVLELSWTMWNERNTALHGTNQKELRENHLQQLRQQVDYAYQRANELRTHYAHEINIVFKMKYTKRKKQGVVALETWMKLAENVLKTATMRSKSKLTQWLN